MRRRLMIDRQNEHSHRDRDRANQHHEREVDSCQQTSTERSLRRYNITSRHCASRRAGLILIHRFPLALLFHNHSSLPVSIRGYHLHTPSLLYISFLTLPLFSLSPPFSVLPRTHLPSPSLPTHIICPYNCYIGLQCTISSNRPTSCLYNNYNNSVELLRYRCRRPTYLLADWSCYATPRRPITGRLGT